MAEHDYRTVADMVAELLQHDQTLPVFYSGWDTLQEEPYAGEVEIEEAEYIEVPGHGVHIKYHGDDRPATGMAVILR